MNGKRAKSLRREDRRLRRAFLDAVGMSEAEARARGDAPVALADQLEAANREMERIFDHLKQAQGASVNMTNTDDIRTPILEEMSRRLVTIRAATTITAGHAVITSRGEVKETTREWPVPLGVGPGGLSCPHLSSPAPVFTFLCYPTHLCEACFVEFGAGLREECDRCGRVPGAEETFTRVRVRVGCQMVEAMFCPGCMVAVEGDLPWPKWVLP